MGLEKPLRNLGRHVEQSEEELIRGYLSLGEAVEDHIAYIGRGSNPTYFYLTNKRLLRYSIFLLRKEFDELSIDKITSITLEKRVGRTSIFIGIVLFIIGLLIFWQKMFLLNKVGIFFLIVGGIIILSGYVEKTTWYQVKGVGLDEQKWRIFDFSNKFINYPQYKRFVENLRKKLGNKATY